MLSAIPDTTWFPAYVMQARPWTMASATDAATPAASPSQAEPVTYAVAAAANAAASILPSSPMSTTPERSAKSPPSAARTRGAAPRTVAAARRERRTAVSAIGARRARRPHRAVARAAGGGDEEEIARPAQHEPVPHPLRDETDLPALEAEGPLAGRLVEHDVERAGQEVEHLVAARMHLPLVGVEVGGRVRVLRPDDPIPGVGRGRPEDVGRPRDGNGATIGPEVHEGRERVEGRSGRIAHSRLSGRGSVTTAVP